MVALSFSEQKHYDKLVKREKMQTIRPRNKKRIEQMKRLGIQIYWKQRSPKGFKFYDAEYHEGFIVVFDHRPNGCEYPDNSRYTLLKPDEKIENYEWNWALIPYEEAEQIATKDGFFNYYEMQKWFYKRYGSSVLKEFDLIRWNEVL